ncbi:hypothetical protein NDU88_004445 [Pleurodeles waltl]|uniref:Uncharacterized protein n=1 Tax=Pleurodeles waltl TaxID=8319 RepID=A0AAV7TR97_PLEWA|nr:hypothetical protein NDU88_004445 [Pleurodeles waltl]
MSRELESPATLHVKPGTESRFSEPCDRDNKDIGNPDERIPDPFPADHGDEDAIARTGNPDIRVPDVMERDNGLHGRRAFITEDAEEEDAEKGGRTQNPSRRPQEEEQKSPNPGDTTTGKEGPKECELRQVPGGTWLNQVFVVPESPEQRRAQETTRCFKAWQRGKAESQELP